MRAPVSTSENRVHDAKKFGPRRCFRFFQQNRTQGGHRIADWAEPILPALRPCASVLSDGVADSDRPELSVTELPEAQRERNSGVASQSKLAFDRSWASYWPVSEVFFGWLKAPSLADAIWRAFQASFKTFNLASIEHTSKSRFKASPSAIACERDPSCRRCPHQRSGTLAQYRS